MIKFRIPWKKKPKKVYRKRIDVKNCVYVNGIPIPKSTFDVDVTRNQGEAAPELFANEAVLDEEEEKTSKRNVVNKKAFRKYDTDFDGTIDFEEFYTYLGDMNITLNKGKARRFFNLCDKKHRGRINKEEFQLALFATDSNSEDRTVGFRPASILSPKDAFFLFANPTSKVLEMEDFAELVTFLKLNVSAQEQTMLFMRYDADGSGFIDYREFLRIWLRIADVKGELEKRGIRFHRLAPTFSLISKLEKVLAHEEEEEGEVMNEVVWYDTWQDDQAEKKLLCTEAEALAEAHLARALDAAGAVYVFGTGIQGCFAKKQAKTHIIDFDEFEKIHKVWQQRVTANELVFEHEAPAEEAALNDLKASEVRKLRKKEKMEASQKWNLPSQNTPPHFRGTVLDGKRGDVEKSKRQSLQLRFKGLQVAENTSWLWGRNVTQITCGHKVAYAKTEEGQLFCWGGIAPAWKSAFSMCDDPVKTVTVVEHLKTSKKKKTVVQYEAVMKPNSPRTAIMKMSTGKQKKKNFWRKSRTAIRRLYGDMQPPVDPGCEDTFDMEYSLVQLAEHFDIEYQYHTQGKMSNLEYLQAYVYRELPHDRLQVALNLRGLKFKNKTKKELVRELSNALLIEKECMGKPFYVEMKKLENKYIDLKSQAKYTKADHTRHIMFSKWEDLRALKLKVDVADKEEYKELLREYNEGREELRVIKSKHQARKREGLEDTKGQQSNKIEVSGITSRGPGLHTFRGNTGVHDIDVGGGHVVAIHSSGQLYSWGVSTAGRLGAKTQDSSTPSIVEAVKAIRFKQVSCGYSHSSALATNGSLYVFGSAGTGKLGIAGPSMYDTHCSKPSIIKLPAKQRIKQVSCGNGHTAAVTTKGQLFVWGCTDGGRLGLEAFDRSKVNKFVDPIGNVETPMLVHTLSDYHLTQVSCGLSHTGVVSLYQDANRTGGEVFIAGSAYALGVYTPVFKRVASLDGVNVKQVCCGTAQTACVTVSGELYTWGANPTGCTGHPISLASVPNPSRVFALYQKPDNLALNRPCMQSSTLKGLKADLAVNGIIDCSVEKQCAHTRREDRPFWQIDLGGNCNVESVSIWNRTENQFQTGTSEIFQRIFPFYIMLSRKPFEIGSGRDTLNWGKRDSVWHLVSENKSQVNPMIWEVPEGTVVRYVRIQVDSLSILSMAQVQVFGRPGGAVSLAKVDSVAFGENVLLVATKQERSKRRLQQLYVRALMADRANEKLLRQYRTYEEFYKQYLNERNLGECQLCTDFDKCSLCNLFKKCDTSFMPADCRKTMTLSELTEGILSYKPGQSNYKDYEVGNKDLATYDKDYVEDLEDFEEPPPTVLHSPLKKVQALWSQRNIKKATPIDVPENHTGNDSDDSIEAIDL